MSTKINRQQFEQYLNDPENLNASSIGWLEELIKEFPYCQSAYLLYVKNLLKESNIGYYQQLKVASAYVSDRRVLKQLLDPDLPEHKIEPPVIEVPEQDVKVSQPAELSREVNRQEKPKAKEVVESEKPVADKVITEDKPKIVKPVERKGFSHGKKSKREELLERVQRRLEELKVEKLRIEKFIEDEQHRISSKIDNKDKREPVEEKTVAGKAVKPKSKKTEQSVFDDIQAGLNKKEISIPDYFEDIANVIGDAENKASKKDLIDKFIEEEPSIGRAEEKKHFFSPDEQATHSLADHDDMVSETLAKIYLQQGKIAQAIKIYERLSLKFPEKSTYFAGQIDKIKQIT